MDCYKIVALRYSCYYHDTSRTWKTFSFYSTFLNYEALLIFCYFYCRLACTFCFKYVFLKQPTPIKYHFCVTRTEHRKNFHEVKYSMCPCVRLSWGQLSTSGYFCFNDVHNKYVEVQKSFMHDINIVKPCLIQIIFISSCIS